MKHFPRSFVAVALPLLTFGALFVLQAAPAPSQLATTRLPSGIARFSAGDLAPSAYFRIESSVGFKTWATMVTLQSPPAGTVEFDDSGAPRAEGRFYRLATVPAGEIPLTGDHLATSAGDVVLHPGNHASFVMGWNGLTIHSDPVGGATPYAGLPPRR